MNNLRPRLGPVRQWIALSSFMLGTGCGTVAPATTAPTIRTMPSAVPFPTGISEGEGGIILETDQPASVRDSQSGKVLCRYTPCSFVGDLGAHELLFTSLSDPIRESRAVIHLVPERTVARHTLGEKAKASPGFIVLVALGVVGLGLSIGGFVSSTEDRTYGVFPPSPRTTALIGAGGAMFWTGLIGGIIAAPRATPGATEQFRF